MVKTNAERQAAYRKRLKARASGAELGARAREAAERAVLVIWGAVEREDDASLDGFADFAAYRASYQNPKNGNATLTADCRLYLGALDLDEAERAALQAVIDLADALELRD